MNNWDLIRIATPEKPYINILINGIQTLVIKNNRNPQFSLVVHEDEISNILLDHGKEDLSNNSCIPGGIEIGRFALPGKMVLRVIYFFSQKTTVFVIMLRNPLFYLMTWLNNIKNGLRSVNT